MVNDEKQIWNDVFEYMKNKYPRRNLRMSGKMVECDGDIVFNTDGYNLLYNLQRLCKVLEDELL